MQDGSIVWLASYPKSGNTWVRLLLGNLLGSREDDSEAALSPVGGITSSRGLFEHYTGVSSYELTATEVDQMRPAVYRKMAQHSEDLQFMKAHDAFGRLPDGQPWFPPDCTRGAIYIVRDPLDVAVSYTHHRGDGDFEKTVDILNDPQKTIGGGNELQLHQFMGDWSAHYRSWAYQDDIPVRIVRYEDLQKDTAGELQNITQFLGIERDKFEMSIDDAVAASRFDRLQQVENEKGFQERPAESARFFRAGRSGEGREALSEILQSALIAYHGEVMRQLGYIEE